MIAQKRLCDFAHPQVGFWETDISEVWVQRKIIFYISSCQVLFNEPGAICSRY